MYLMSNTFIATLYLQSRDRVQEQAMNRAWCIIWHIAVPSNMGPVTAVYGLNQEFHAVRREVRAGMYGILPYIIAQTLVQIPFMFLLSVFCITASGYGVAGWNPEHWRTMVAIVAADLFAWECIAQLLSAIFSNALLGILMFMRLWFQSLFFAGIYIEEEAVPLPMRWLCRVFSLRYSINSMTYTEFHDTTWKGAVPDAAAPRGYSCPNDPTYKHCVGHKGTQVLDSLHNTFGVISNEDKVVSNIYCCLILGFACKLIFTFIAVRKTRGGTAVKPSFEVPVVAEMVKTVSRRSSRLFYGEDFDESLRTPDHGPERKDEANNIPFVSEQSGSSVIIQVETL